MLTANVKSSSVEAIYEKIIELKDDKIKLFLTNEHRVTQESFLSTLVTPANYDVSKECTCIVSKGDKLRYEEDDNDDVKYN